MQIKTRESLYYKLMKKLIIGIGNEYCGNDAIGLIIAQKLKEDLPDYDLKTGAFSGIELLDAIEGYDNVILIDSVVSNELPPGEVVEFKIEDFSNLRKFSYIHSMNIATALEVGRQLNMKSPEKIKVFGIVIDKKGEIGEDLSVVVKGRLGEIINSLKSRI